MRIVLSPIEWREKLILFSQEEFNLPDKVNPDDHLKSTDANDSKGTFKERTEKFEEKLTTQYDRRMIHMRQLFAGLPRFEKICENQLNNFVDSCCKEYVFEYEDEDEDEDKDKDECEYEYEYEDEYKYENINESHEKVIDLKYIINLCGYILTDLDIEDYPFSEIMPLINNNCPNLEALKLAFKEIKSQDFNNVFSNMSHLNALVIIWRCEYSTLPISLVESLEHVGATLELFLLKCYSKKNSFCLPHSLASVFRGFVVLKKLCMVGFEITQPILESIGQMPNLVTLTFVFYWKEHQMLRNKINMYPIGNLKNLEHLDINFDYGVTDEFLINLCNNAKKLNFLSIATTHITDNGIKALNNFKVPVLFLDKPYKK
ncbi:uncharacterized protein LOC122859640 [Aphidius gifuensis]|uniref:uncharacterized protein LOC122859640 n=1 Tax=Aphidius gifuensis TaxID=684658 RepID=UPI001CDB9623|nr:uncharacterized protein LOC122859640 [Aphidius gifuensis]